MSDVNTTFSDKELVRDAIRRIAVGPNRGRDISAAEAEQIMRAILRHDIDDLEAALFLIALRMKGESPDEYQGLYTALEQIVETEPVAVAELHCLADPYNGYQRYLPATPFVPCILAACGKSALLTGVETVAPKHGLTAHQVLRLAGVKVTINAHKAARTIESAGWAYLDQSQFAGDLYALVGLRHRMVKRTALTTLERLLMPLRAKHATHLTLGYVHKAYPEIYTRLACRAGYASLGLIKGREGGLMPALNKPVRGVYADFATPGASSMPYDIAEPASGLAGKVDNVAAQGDCLVDAERCLEQGLEVLAGAENPLRNSVIVTAALILAQDQRRISFAAAVEKVQDCLDNGSAQARFDCLIEA